LRILTLDIETTPNLADVWGLWKQNVSLNQLRESGYVMCFAAKWLGDRRTMFVKGSDVALSAHHLMSEADAIITYNGIGFDLPYLNSMILDAGLTPPIPYKSIDLLPVVRKEFKYPSYKLQYVANRLRLGGKLEHEGHELWIKCRNGDEKAWAKMEKYNRQDVKLTEKLYLKILPWIKNHPNMGLFHPSNTMPVCTNCGGVNVVKNGTRMTQTGIYQRYYCNGCGTHLRGRYTQVDASIRKNILRQAT
jgi:hypothetical protein